MRPEPVGYFGMKVETILVMEDLGAGLWTEISPFSTTVGPILYNGSPSPPNGGFNDHPEMLRMGLSHECLVQSFDLAAESMYKIYLDGTIFTTPGYGLFFAHMRQTA